LESLIDIHKLNEKIELLTNKMEVIEKNIGENKNGVSQEVKKTEDL
jgi:hypothetical protein